MLYSGVVIWLFENGLCARLPQWWKLHALWHLLAGYASYLWVLSMIVWRAAMLGFVYSLQWQFGMPYIEVVKSGVAGEELESAV